MRNGVILLPLALFATAYIAGWIRLAHRAATIPHHRLALGMLAYATVAVALASPLDTLAHESFSAHMVQHLLIILAAPALLLADALSMTLWSLPPRRRRPVGILLARDRPLRRLLALLTAPPLAWLLYVITLWAWHAPPLYDAAVGHPVLHHIEHLALFVAAVLFWWPLVAAAPRLRPPASLQVRIVYLVLGAFQSAALGLILTVSPRLLYASYATSGWDQAALEDQAWGGIVMWAIGGAVDMAALFVLLSRLLANPPGGGDGPQPIQGQFPALPDSCARQRRRTTSTSSAYRRS